MFKSFAWNFSETGQLVKTTKGELPGTQMDDTALYSWNQAVFKFQLLLM